MALLEAFRGIASQAEPPSVSAEHKMGDLRKKLRWLINNPPPDLAKVMTITPDLAAVMMERNSDDEWRNRPHSEKGKLRYIRAMKRGWQLTGETVIFSKTGRLINGQHRLMACIEADASFPCVVVFGIDDAAFKFLDIGIARTAGHIFAIEGIPNSNQVAAACRLLYGYMQRSDWDGRASDAENDQLLAFYDQHQRMQDSLPYARHLYQDGLMPIRWGLFCHYICARSARNDANAFFDQVASGVGISNKDMPAYRIRKRLLDNIRATERLSDVYLGAYFIQAWNAHRRGERRQLFRWRSDQSPHEAFPRAF